MTILTWLPLDAGFASRYTKHLSLEQKGLFLDLYITAIETSNSSPEFLTKLLTLNCSEENNQKVIHLVNHLVSVGFFEYLNSLITRQISRFGTLRENGKKGGRPNNQKVTIKKEKEKEKENKKEKLDKEREEVRKKSTTLKEFILFSLAQEGQPNADPECSVPDVLCKEWEKLNGPNDDGLFAKYQNFYEYWNGLSAKKPVDPYKVNWVKTWVNQITR